ncbi:MAG: biopolymer transporter ExbD, partial [Candidatus Omnitrophota bacterium]
MKRRARGGGQRLVAEINITPFTDVILVLLVIFMITTPLIYQTNIQIKLPEVTRSRAPVRSPGKVEITVTDGGLVYLDKAQVSDDQLKKRVEALSQEDPSVGVFLRADRAVKFKHIVRILDILT